MTISYLLRKTRGQHYIFIAIYEGGQTELFSTGQKTNLKAWSKSQRQPVDPASETSMVIERMKEEVLAVRRRMIAQEKPVSAYTLKQEYLKTRNHKQEAQLVSDKSAKVNNALVVTLIEKWKEEGLDDYQDSTIAVVKTSVNMFKTFLTSRYPRIERKEVNLDVIREYSRFLETKRQVSDNTHGKRMKHLRRFLLWMGWENEAVKKIKIRTVKAAERNIIHLTMEELTALEAVNVSDSAEMQKAKDMWLLGAYSGLRVSDLKRISPHRIQNGSIDITQKKNRKLNSVPILPQMDAILKRYDYHAPHIAEQQVNESIKLVCKEAGINKPIFKKSKKAGKLIEVLKYKYELITTHVAGKTFISLAGERWGLTPQDVAAICGKDIKTILGYYMKPDVNVAKQKMIEAENRAQMKAV